MLRYKMLIAYDGTNYFGWQKTKAGPSIQGMLHEALLRLTQESVVPEAASRTDRGVHARGQCIAMDLQRSWDPNVLTRGLNALLPGDIRVLSVEEVDGAFHPTLDAVSKEYRYRLSLGPIQIPMERRYAWHVPQELSLPAMQEAAALLTGKKDFSALANEKESDPVCVIERVAVEEEAIALKGNRFLYKMARNMAGLLVDVGKGKIAPEQIPSILASKDRKQAGVTAPAHGLFLEKVLY